MDTLTLEKRRLLERLEKAIVPLHFQEKEHRSIITAFNISFEGHRLAPRRATGEIYFMHVFRQFMKMTRLMIRHHVSSSDLLAAILLHDVVEDAEKGKTSDFMVRSQIHLQVNRRIEYYVMCLTKRKNIESRGDYLRRIIGCEEWRVLIAKGGDANDNIITLAATPLHNQAEKVREIFVYYPIIKKKTIHLITCEGMGGVLPKWRGWIAITNALHHNLRRNAWKERRRLENLEIKVM